MWMIVNSQSVMSNAQADKVDGNIEEVMFHGDISRITTNWLYSMEHDGGKVPVSRVVKDYKIIVRDPNNLIIENTGN